LSSDVGQQARRERFERARALIDLGRYTQALDELAPLLAGPDDADAISLAAQALLALGRMDEAVNMAERAIAADPQEEWGHRLRSRALMGAARTKKGPERDLLLGKAVQSAREAARLAPSQVMTLRSASEVERVAGNYVEAEGAIRWAIQLDPTSPETWAADGLLAIEHGDTDRAERSNRRAIELNPNMATAWNNLGVALQRQGRWREATAAYIQSVRLNPPESLFQANAARIGLVLLGIVAMLIPLPVLLLPYGSIIYLAVYCTGTFLFRPGGPLRQQAETLGIRTALRAQRLPLQRRFTQAVGLRLTYRVAVLLVFIAFLLTANRTPSGVEILAFLFLLAAFFWQGIRAKRRAARDPS
jgi:tetratricopeptide (TPR) repeat protein